MRSPFPKLNLPTIIKKANVKPTMQLPEMSREQLVAAIDAEIAHHQQGYNGIIASEQHTLTNKAEQIEKEILLIAEPHKNNTAKHAQLTWLLELEILNATLTASDSKITEHHGKRPEGFTPAMESQFTREMAKARDKANTLQKTHAQLKLLSSEATSSHREPADSKINSYVETLNQQKASLGNNQDSLDLTQATEDFKQTRSQFYEELTSQSPVVSALRNLSTPLDALRQFSHERQGRLPGLDLSKYPYDQIPNVLFKIQETNSQINELLERREQLERAIQFNPILANDDHYAKEIYQNTIALKRKMDELAKQANEAKRSGALEAISNVTQWTYMARELQQGVNAACYGKPIAPTIDTVNHQVSEKNSHYVRTQYKHQIAPFNWQTRTLVAQIKQADGSTKVEDVVFKRADLKAMLQEFVTQNNIEYEVRITERKNGIDIVWPTGQYKKEWLDHLKREYQQIRQEQVAVKKEVENSSDSAKVTLENPSPAKKSGVAERPKENNPGSSNEVTASIPKLGG